MGQRPAVRASPRAVAAPSGPLGAKKPIGATLRATAALRALDNWSRRPLTRPGRRARLSAGHCGILSERRRAGAHLTGKQTHMMNCPLFSLSEDPPWGTTAMAACPSVRPAPGLPLNPSVAPASWSDDPARRNPMGCSPRTSEKP